MHKLEESRLTLNYGKYEVGVEGMFYMGDALSGEGLKVSIPNFATKSTMGPNCERRKVGIGTQRNKALSRNQNQLTRAPVMAYFREGAEIRLTTDASPLGVG